jgi:hypothetical protein
MTFLLMVMGAEERSLAPKSSGSEDSSYTTHAPNFLRHPMHKKKLDTMEILALLGSSFMNFRPQPYRRLCGTCVRCILDSQPSKRSASRT